MMNNIRHIRINKAGVVFFTICILLLIGKSTINAYEPKHTMPDFTDEKAGLKVVCQNDDGGNTVLIDGVQFEAFLVATPENTFGSVTYNSTDSYSELNINFEGMTAAESNDYAKKLSDLQQEKGYVGKRAVTGSDGCAVFNDLEYGIYLLKQVDSSGTAKQYSEYEPFLVLVPEITDQYEWGYDVTVEPKSEVIKTVTPEPEVTDPPKPPKTGDDYNLDIWIPIMALSFLGFFICLFFLTNKM